MRDPFTDLSDRLFRQNEFAIKLGTERIRAALDAEGSPDRRFLTVLVAGTNGKGSVSSFIHAGLKGAGLRVGLYTSPHLVDARERMRVDGRPISPADFVALGEPFLARWGESHVPVAQRLTFFELLTGMACLYFAHEQVDVAVLEVGMGGRLDATNALDPALSVVTPVAFDHERHLGSDLATILGEKLGILRAGRPAVVCCPEVWTTARTETAVLAGPTPSPLWVEGDVFAGWEGQIEVAGEQLPTDWVPLQGQHQVRNAACALAALELARQALGWRLDPPARMVGALAHARWPGRWTRVTWRGRPVLVDGAHNPHGALAAARFLEEHFAEPVTLVMGALADKNVLEMCRSLASRARRVVAVPLEQAKGRTAAELAEAARAAGIADVVEAGTAAAGLDRAVAHAEPVVALGSLYLAGTVLRLTGATAESLAVWE